MSTYIDAMLRGYLVAALWSSTEMREDGDGVYLDEIVDIDDIPAEQVAAARSDCEDFAIANAAVLDLAYTQCRYSAEQAGIDFWFSRNRHGTGFFDRKIPGADYLQRAACAYSSLDLYLGDDGKVHGF